MNDLKGTKIADYIEALSSSASTPGGGNAVAVLNTMAASLMLMSLRISILKKDPKNSQALEIEKKLELIKSRSMDLAIEDSLRFKNVMATWRTGGEDYEKALKASAEVSLLIARESLEHLNIIFAQDLKKYEMIITDVGISVQIASAAFNGAMMNYMVNVKFIESEENIADMSFKSIKLRKEFESKFEPLLERINNILG